MPPSRSRPVAALALALAGSIGIAAAWILVAQATRGQGSWMAVLAALDAALLLRMGGFRSGAARAACGVLATALAITLANWGIVANEVGRMLGLAAWTSMGKLGFEHAWVMVRLANDAIDLAWLAAGLVVAAVCSR